jgi:zinc transporter ZupT
MSTTTETQDELHPEKKFNIKAFKIVMLFVIFLCSLSGVLPKLIPAIARNNTVLSFLNCFSAGIFLGMALFHIIPEGAEQYESWATEKGIERPFPLAFVLIFVGYLIVLAVDRVIAGFLLKLTGKENEAHIGHSHGGGHSHDHSHDHNHDHVHHERKNT